MNLHVPASDPISELASNVAVPFGQARAMPKSVYTSDEFLAAELKHVFAREWYCVGRAAALPDPGDYVTFELAGQPLMLIRDRDGRLHAQSNVCLHRMSTLLEGRGNRRSITCPYHGWTYETDGRLRVAPAMSGNAGFCKESYRLPQIRCETWLGWAFVSLDPDIQPVAERFADVEDLIRPFDMTNYTEWFNEQFTWDTNWKVLAENFMESYHLPVCHAGTIGGLSKTRRDDLPAKPAALQLSYHSEGAALPHRLRASGQPADGRRPAPHHRPAGALPEPARHADARVFLVPVLAPPGHWSGPGHLRRRHVE